MRDVSDEMMTDMESGRRHTEPTPKNWDKGRKKIKRQTISPHGM
jgi:hypothetical protein